MFVLLLVVASRRSGSNTLAAELARRLGAADDAGEILNDGMGQGGTRLDVDIEVARRNVTALREALARRYCAARHASSTADTRPCVVIGRVFPEHVLPHADLLERLLGEAADAIVVLRRANATAQLHSLRRSMANGCWATSPQRRSANDCTAIVGKRLRAGAANATLPVPRKRAVARFARQIGHWHERVERAARLAAPRRPPVLGRFETAEFLRASSSSTSAWTARMDAVATGLARAQAHDANGANGGEARRLP